MANVELLSTMAEVTLTNGFVIKFEAIDPATGLAVTGVKVSNVAIYGDTPDDGGGAPGDGDVAPLFLPVPVEVTRNAG